jgi:hypothetical protein
LAMRTSPLYIGGGSARSLAPIPIILVPFFVLKNVLSYGEIIQGTVQWGEGRLYSYAVGQKGGASDSVDTDYFMNLTPSLDKDWKLVLMGLEPTEPRGKRWMDDGLKEAEDAFDLEWGLVKCPVVAAELDGAKERAGDDGPGPSRCLVDPGRVFTVSRTGGR